MSTFILDYANLTNTFPLFAFNDTIDGYQLSTFFKGYFLSISYCKRLPLLILISIIPYSGFAENLLTSPLLPTVASPLLTIGGFFLSGLLLAFTPCVFPLLPVLIGIISGKNISPRRSSVLAISYIVGGAVVYSIAGIIVALFGAGILRWLQDWWISAILAGVFIILALALLEKLPLYLPLRINHRLNQMASHYNNGSILGAFIVGGLANLILSPCVTPPLAGALIYISTTGNLWLGGSALFALAIGSGLPLLILALGGKKILPTSGRWLNISKQLLALLMLAVAAYLISKTVDGYDELILIIYSALALVVLGSNFTFWRQPWPQRGAIAVIIVVSLALNNYCDQQKIAHVDDKFVWVTTTAQLDQQLQQARAQQRPVLLDFYARWCSACKELDIRTFANPEVQQQLANYTLIRVNVTDNNNQVQALQQRYRIFALPTIIFLDKNSTPINGAQIYGFITGRKLLEQLATHQKN